MIYNLHIFTITLKSQILFHLIDQSGLENRNSKSISIGLISQLLYELSLLAKNEILPTSQNFKKTIYSEAMPKK